jgi:GNAT superfamily N-acetyltransferase
MGGIGDGGTAEIHIRAATPDDDAAVLGLLAASMGWVPDELSARFLAWKHRQNPAGPSPAWVAVDEASGEVVGLRTFLRWRFSTDGYGGDADGGVVDAVRAVDTATHPDHQGRGIFSRLTRHALEELRAQGVAFVFNTPNDRSRPGYLKMGWQEVGRLPVAVRPRSLGALARVGRARAPADKWSTPTDAGSPAAEALTDDVLAESALGPAATGAGGAAAAPRLRTERTGEHLRWRYGFPALHYRALTGPDGPGQGLVVFRLRRRGAATEAAVCELLVPDGRQRAATTRRLLRAVVRASGADHAVLVGRARPGLGLLPVPGQGPTLVWRAVAPGDDAPPHLAAWDLSLGDVELF